MVTPSANLMCDDGEYLMEIHVSYLSNVGMGECIVMLGGEQDDLELDICTLPRTRLNMHTCNS